MLCESCLKNILNNISTDCIEICKCLNKIGATNRFKAIGKSQIEISSNLRKYRVENSVYCLGVLGLITEIKLEKPSKYHLTEDGAKLMELYYECKEAS